MKTARALPGITAPLFGFFVCLGAFTNETTAALVTWTGACIDNHWHACCTNDNVNFVSNWDTGKASLQGCEESQFPGSGDDVDVGTSHVILECCAITVVNSFFSQGTFVFEPGSTLQVATTADYGGPLEVNGASLAGGIHSAGDHVLIDVAAQPVGLTVKTNASLRLESDTTWQGNNAILLEGNSSITNTETAEFLMANDREVTGTTTSYFLNQGSFVKQGGTGISRFQLDCAQSPTGSCGFNNDGLVDVRTGELLLESDGIHSGLFNVESGATLHFQKDIRFAAGSMCTGSGLVRFSNANISIDPGWTLVIPRVWGTPTVQSGHLKITQEMSNNGIILTNGSLFEIAEGAVATFLRITATTSQIEVNGQLLTGPLATALTFSLNQSTLHIADGALMHLTDGKDTATSGGSQVNVSPGGELRIDGITPLLSSTVGSLNNDGAVNVQSGRLVLSNAPNIHSGAFHVAPAAEMHVNGSTVFLNGARIDGGGDVLIQSSNSIASDANVHFENVELRGTLTNNGVVNTYGSSQTGFFNQIGTGELNVTPAAVLTLTGASRFEAQSVLRNNGTVVADVPSPVFFNAQARFINESGAELRLENAGSIRVNSTQYSTNRGQVNKVGEGWANFQGRIRNEGRIEVQAGRLIVNDLFRQTSGEVVLMGGALWNQSGNTIALAGGHLRGSGQILTPRLQNGGVTIDPGFPIGVFNVLSTENDESEYVQGASGTLMIDFVGPEQSSGLSNDVLSVSGTANLGGTLKLNSGGVLSQWLETRM